MEHVVPQYYFYYPILPDTGGCWCFFYFMRSLIPGTNTNSPAAMEGWNGICIVNRTRSSATAAELGSWSVVNLSRLSTLVLSNGPYRSGVVHVVPVSKFGEEIKCSWTCFNKPLQVLRYHPIHQFYGKIHYTHCLSHWIIVTLVKLRYTNPHCASWLERNPAYQ